VLVVDDVITTGATMRAAATTLRDAGAASVIALAAARTPLKQTRDRPDTDSDGLGTTATSEPGAAGRPAAVGRGAVDPA
jgi:adenine/guanine phosphoribosyltransferase-like PRPP-binding protein